MHTNAFTHALCLLCLLHMAPLIVGSLCVSSGVFDLFLADNRMTDNPCRFGNIFQQQQACQPGAESDQGFRRSWPELPLSLTFGQAKAVRLQSGRPGVAGLLFAALHRAARALGL